MRSGIRAPSAAAAVVVILAAARSPGAPNSDDVALARELFNQARALVARGDHEQACPKFEESQRLDPGGGTLLNLALCHERIGKTATAWAEFGEARRLAHRDNRSDRAELAQSHFDALAPRLSRLRIVVPPAARAPGLIIRRNGTVLGAGAWNDALPVDPGRQLVQAEAPGKVAFQKVVSVGVDADLKVVTIEPLEDRPAVRGNPEASRNEGGWQLSQELVGYTLGGTGLVALGAGGYFLWRALDLDGESHRQCQAPAACSVDSFETHRRAQRAGDIATGFAAVGTILVGTGVYLVLSAPSPSEPKTALGISPWGATLERSF